MKWKKPSAETLELFETLLPDDPQIERRKMFGMPCAFVNGNMFVGVHEDNIVLRLDDHDRDDISANHGAQAFEPSPGRSMREYVVLPAAVRASPGEARAWLERSLAYVRSLTAKPKKPASRPARGGAKATPARRRKS